MPLQDQLETAAAVLGTPRTLHIVHKAQCIASFNTAKSPGGLYISLADGAALCPDYLPCDTQAGPVRAYLRVQDIPAADQSGATGSGALNQAGQEEYTFSTGVAYDSHYALAICDDSGAVIGEVGLQDVRRGVDGIRAADSAVEIPAALRAAIANVISATDAADAASTAAAGFAFQAQPSKFSDTLRQVDPGDPAAHAVPTDPADWKCAACGLTSNLWFNLGDGYIGCGRKNAMGTGGEQHALKHYEETGSMYPLVVKLGTITPDGKADVFCYDASENDMVVDTQLAQHLAHWGLDPAGMVKTERTMAELNLDLNQRVELASIQEEGKALAPLTGAGYVGMRNTGNSCYMNSLLQALFSVPEVQQRLAPGCDPAARVHTALLREAVASRAVTSQVYPALHKLAASLLSQREVTDDCIAAVQAHAAAAAAGSPAVPEKELADARDAALAAVQSIAIVPANLRRVVAAQHVEFTQGTQQDVLEYLRHFIAQCEQAEQRGQLGVVAGLPEGVPRAMSTLFTSQIETRLQCGASGGVQYSTTPENVLGLPVPVPEQLSTAPMKRARSDSGEAEEPVAPTVPFDVCLAAWAAEDTVENWLSPATGERGTATTRRRIARMPRVLCVGMKRYTVNERWEPVKLDVLVPAPEHLSLEHLRGHGMQAGEVPLPEAAPAAQPEASPDIVAAVTGMGFTAEAAQRAALACGNSDAEAAVSWVLAHMDDPDLNEPLPGPASGSSASAGPAVSADALAMLCSMGFVEPQAKRALQENGNNVEAATAWICEHMDEMGPDGSLPGDGAGADAAAPQAELDDGPGEYELVACVSHIGKTTGGGHYVCHVRRPCGWVQINDNKVTTSQSPPLDRGYLYVYRRTDVPVAGIIGQPIGL